MPDRVKSFREIGSRNDCSRFWLGFLKSIRNGPRKIKNLIQHRAYRAEIGQWGERMELDFRKKNRRDIVIHSSSFKTPEVRDISQKEAGKL